MIQKLDRIPIGESNVRDYILFAYGCPVKFVKHHDIIENFKCVKPVDCNSFDILSGVMSIANCINFAKKTDMFASWYAVGLNMFNRKSKRIGRELFKVYRTMLAKSGLSTSIKFRSVYRLTYGPDDILRCIRNGKPMLLHIPEDGRNCYKDQTVTVIGYNVFQLYNDTKVTLLVVSDNLSDEIRYVDPTLLPFRMAAIF